MKKNSKMIEMACEQIDEIVVNELQDALRRCIQDAFRPLDTQDCLVYIEALKTTLKYFMIPDEYKEFLLTLRPHTPDVYADYQASHPNEEED